MTDLPPLREVVQRHGLIATKALGQNFLFDEQLLSRITLVPGDLNGENVLEVGPGPGGLTRALLRRGARVTAIEMDSRCLPALAELAEAFPGQLTVIEGDATKIAPETLFDAPWHVAANLPYNVGTALFVGWLSGPNWPPPWRSLTLMFQQEVAERIVAPPGMLERVTEAAFGQRRKMLRQSLKGLPGALDALERLGIDPQRRAETLDVADFVAIARLLTK